MRHILKYLLNKYKTAKCWKWFGILMPIPMSITHGIMSLGFHAEPIYVNIVQARFLVVQMGSCLFYMRQIKKGYI